MTANDATRETPPSGTSRNFGYLPALDGIRAVAIVAVFGVHLSLLPRGGMGVMMFFVLSGFLMTTLLLNERHNTGAISPWLFYARRALRLLPAVVVVNMAACLVSLSDRGTLLSHVILHFAPASLFCVGNWLSAVHLYFVGGTRAHTWTLSVEAQFNLAWALVLALLIKVGARLLTGAMVAIAGVALSIPALRLKDGLRSGLTEDRLPTTTQHNASGFRAGLDRCQ